MSGGDLTEYINTEDEDYSESNMLRDRRNQGLFHSIQQRQLEMEAEGVREGGSVYRERHAEERKEGRVERRGESQRIMRDVLGGKVNPANLRMLQEGMINAGRRFGMDLVGASLLEGFEGLQSGLDVVQSAYDFVNRGRELNGAGMLENIVNLPQSINLLRDVSGIFPKAQSGFSGDFRIPENAQSGFSADGLDESDISSIGRTTINNITNHSNAVVEAFNDIFKGGMKEQAPISDIYISDSSSTSSSGISEASQLRSGDSGGREDVGRPQRRPAWLRFKRGRFKWRW